MRCSTTLVILGEQQPLLRQLCAKNNKLLCASQSLVWSPTLGGTRLHKVAWWGYLQAQHRRIVSRSQCISIYCDHNNLTDNRYSTEAYCCGSNTHSRSLNNYKITPATKGVAQLFLPVHSTASQVPQSTAIHQN